MTFYAIKDTEDGDRNQLIYKSLLEGVARFGWSYTEYHDLRKINDMSWEEIDKIDAKEKTDIRYIWGKSYWLLNVNPDDYFVYINIPQYGDCCLVKITSKYFFNSIDLDGEFRHSFECEFIKKFNRNNEIALKLQYSALRPRQRYHRIYDEINFRNLITELQETNSNIENISEDLIGKQIENFSNDLSPIILEKIVHYFSRKRFEDLIMAILKERENNGEIINPYVYRGWGVDQGCDIEFTYFNQILNKKEMVIIQLKAYTGKAFISEAITNLSNHLNNGKTANQAIIMTTANIIDEKDFLNAKKEFELKYNIPLTISYGKSMISWILRFGTDLLFSGDTFD